jgi:prepilin peptidase CpaA
MAVLSWLPAACVGLIVLVAAALDLRSRHVPLWLLAAGLLAGVGLAASRGGPGLEGLGLGLAAGVLLPLPLVLRGGLGAADALLLATIGAWEGWQAVLWTAWWTAIAGAVLALIAWRRGRRDFAYLPAIAIGFALASLSL